MPIRTTPPCTLVALAALILAVPALASGAPATDLAALLQGPSPVDCTEVNDPDLEPDPPGPVGLCDQWYTVNSSARMLVDSCFMATPLDYDEVEARALARTSSFGEDTCVQFGCVPEMTAANPDVDCGCNDRILSCTVRMAIYCASP